MGPNDVFVLKVVVSRSDAFALPEDVKRPRPASNVATAEMLDIAKRRRREIPTNSVCSILNPFLLFCVRRSPNTSPTNGQRENHHRREVLPRSPDLPMPDKVQRRPRL